MKLRDTIILIVQIIFFNFTAIAQWSSDPSVNTAVCTSANDQQDVRVASDNKGGAIITWRDFRNNIINGDIYTQLLNSDGIPMWTTNGVAICTETANQAAPAIVDDSKGGAIIVWQDWRSGNRDIYAQRVDSMGVIQWTNNGVGVIVKSYEQQNPKHISDGAGGAIIVWQDSVNGNWDIYAQWINSNGTAQWTSGGVAICTAIGDQINPKIETDDSGGAIITWQDKRNGADYDIYAQKVNSTGIVQWTTNGVSICSFSNSQINPKIEPDGQGGAIISWQDKRNGVDYDIYAQRINASGTVQWTSIGVSICSATGSQSAIDLATENINGAIITWKDARNGSMNYDIYAQYINLSGVVQWATNGVVICNALMDQLNPNIIGDGTGGAIIVWEDHRNGAGSVDVYSQRVNSAGQVQWTNNGVVTAIAVSNQTNPKHCSDGNGGAIFIFPDKRSGNFDIYAHHLNAVGTASITDMNQIPEQIIIRVFPNPFTTSTTIIISGGKISSDENIELTIYDITGKKYKESFLSTNMGDGQTGIKINKDNIEIKLKTDNFAAGVYFYQLALRNNDETETIHTGKLIVINPSK